MGHYNGVATQIKVKNRDSRAWRFFSQAFDTGESNSFDHLTLDEHTEDERDLFLSSIHNSTAYFDAWDWQVIEEKEDHTLFSSRGSPRFSARFTFLKIFNQLKDELLVEEGDVVYREVYESGGVENVIAFVNGEFIIDTGYHWVGGEENDAHPSNKNAVEGMNWEEYLAWEQTWFPSWKLSDLK